MIIDRGFLLKWFQLYGTKKFTGDELEAFNSCISIFGAEKVFEYIIGPPDNTLYSNDKVLHDIQNDSLHENILMMPNTRYYTAEFRGVFNSYKLKAYTVISNYIK